MFKKKLMIYGVKVGLLAHISNITFVWFPAFCYSLIFYIDRSESSIWKARHLSFCICCRHGLQWLWSQYTKSETRKIFIGILGFCGNSMSQRKFSYMSGCEENSRKWVVTKAQATFMYSGSFWPRTAHGRPKQTNSE